MPKAKYDGIYHSIKKRIEAQDYPYQSLLPSENTLIEEYACSRNTVRRALAELVADGYVQTMQTFQETARRNHLRAVTKVTKFETVIATEQFAAESGFSEGDELWAVQRVRYLDGKALILDINYFLKEFVPGLTEEIASHSILKMCSECKSSPANGASRWNTQLPVMKSCWIWTVMIAWQWW